MRSSAALRKLPSSVRPFPRPGGAAEAEVELPDGAGDAAVVTGAVVAGP